MVNCIHIDAIVISANIYKKNPNKPNSRDLYTFTKLTTLT